MKGGLLEDKRVTPRHRVLFTAAAALLLAGCASDGGGRSLLAEAPSVSRTTATGQWLRALPPPVRSLDVAVYAFPDLTGQYKESDTTTEYSRAVTQGANAFLTDALQEAGGGRWFSVVERSGLQNLLQERQIISTTVQQYTPDAPGLPPLRFAGVILEGGVVGYDTNTMTGGAGARFLGTGADTEYRRDAITVALRAVSVQTGQVLHSVTTTKTVYSIALQSGTFRYVALNELLEAEVGVTRNEPVTMGVREAIEVAVLSLVLDGARKGLWSFADKRSGEIEIGRFRPKDTSPATGGARRDAARDDIGTGSGAAEPIDGRTNADRKVATTGAPPPVTPTTRFGPENPPPA